MSRRTNSPGHRWLEHWRLLYGGRAGEPPPRSRCTNAGPGVKTLADVTTGQRGSEHGTSSASPRQSPSRLIAAELAPEDRAREERIAQALQAYLDAPVTEKPRRLGSFRAWHYSRRAPAVRALERRRGLS